MADDQVQDSQAEDARQAQKESDEADEVMKKIEENPPDKLEDWPSGKAKYKTFGGPESETSYEDAATSQLGPADLEHHPDGSVSIGGEKVDNPDEYKGDPIPGGPTDPNAPDDLGITKTPRDDDSGDQPAAQGQSSDDHDGREG